MGNVFSSEVSERKTRTEHLEKEVEELKKEVGELKKKVEELEADKWKKNMQGRALKRKYHLWLLGLSCLLLYPFCCTWFSSSSANNEKIGILEFRIESLERTKTQQEGRIRILEKTKTQLEGKIRILEKTEPQQVERSQKYPIDHSQKNDDIKDILNVWLGGKRMRLLYNASVDGFSGESFHKKCDGKGATVTVITSSESYVFGGYAAVEWGDNRSEYVKDYSGESFLFTLKNPHNTPPTKFPLINKALTISNNPDHGPEFGIHAIVCGDYSNVNNYSFTDLDDGVFSKNVNEVFTGLDGKKVFTGQQFFRAKEIQVYQVL